MSSTTRVNIALVLGLAVGLALAAVGGAPAARTVALVEPVGALWVNAIRMTVIPLVLSLIVVGIAGRDDRAEIGRLGLRAVAFAVGSLLVVGLVSTLITPPLFSMLRLDPASVATLRASAAPTEAAANAPTLRDWVVGLIPANPIKAAADGALLPLVIAAAIFAAALARVASPRREAVVDVVRGISDATMVVIGWVLAAAPLGIFALALVLGARLAAGAVQAIGFYWGAVIGVHVVVIAAFYPVASLLGGVPVRLFARALAPAQAVALGTRSSFAALPALVEGATRVLRLPADVSGFVLPLGVATYRLTCCIYWPMGAAFVARLYGVEFGIAEAAIVAAAAVLLNPSVPGIPSGGLFIQAPLYSALGLPLEGIGILIALDAVPDLFKTVLSVTSHMTLAVVAAKGRTAADGGSRGAGVGPREHPQAPPATRDPRPAETELRV